MKKLLLALVLMFATVGVFADTFDDLVKFMKTSCAEEGWTIRSNKEKRVIFIDVKLDADSEGVTQELFDTLKPELVKNFKQGAKQEGVNALKELGVTLAFNFVTKDGKVFKIAITPKDL